MISEFRESKLLPLGPTARRFRVPMKWLRKEAQAGKIPHLDADGIFLFDPSVVERILLKRAARSSGKGANRE